MNKAFKSIAFVAALTMGLLLPLGANAQYYKGSLLRDDHSKDWENSSLLNNRDAVTWTTTITTGGIGEPVPIGDGLLILTAAGLGYAALRRKRSRKNATLLLACMLLLGFTQCKKEESLAPADTNGKVRITLRLVGNTDSRAIVDPTGNGGQYNYAPVSLEAGDRIYVGYNNAYVGYLDYASNGSFSGDVTITETVDDEPLHFYLLGGKGFTPVQDGNTFTLNISDQSSKYPAILYAPSNEVYSSETTSYSAKLLSKCSIMKFNVSTAVASKSCVCVDGMKNKVTVDFTDPNGTDNGFSYSKSGVGQIMMPGGNGANTSFTTWAVVLPQGYLTEAAGKVYINGYEGTRPAISAIGSNQYLSDGVDLTIGTQTDKLIGLFSVGSTKQVRFSKGNLQAVGTTSSSSTGGWTWQFAAHQYDFIGNAAANNAVSGNGTISANGTVDLFGWSTASTYYGINISTTASDYSGAFKDWGENTIGVSAANYWRTLSSAEWQYIVGENSYRTGCGTVAGVENALCTKATVNGKMGFILFPDNFSGGPTGINWQTNYIGHGGMSNSGTTGWGTTIDLNNWEQLEAAGCVFLPVAYVRYDKRMIYYAGCPFGGDYANDKGFYSSSTSRDVSTIYTLRFSNAGYDPNEFFNKSYGYSVRLVRDAN